MTRCWIVFASLALLAVAKQTASADAVSSALSPSDRARFNSGGSVVRPTGYRGWYHAGSRIKLDGNNILDGKPITVPEILDAYVEPNALAAYRKTGRWPDGTQLVKEFAFVKSGQDCDAVTYSCGTPFGPGIFERLYRPRHDGEGCPAVSGSSLIASGAASRALKVGDQAPAFTLNDPDGKPVSSLALLAKGPLVVSFYRGVWCPYCNMELQALEAARSAIEAAGANIVAISPQKAANSRRSARENSLGFPILSDPGNELAAAFGLRFALPDYLIELYRKLGNNLPLINGDESWTLPMPGRFAIAQDGVVRYAEVNPDYTQRPEPEDLLPALRNSVAQAA